jgi:glycosyltransferase involved in cell wall biosynthesis
MRIGLLNAHYLLGGAETVLHQLHRGFQNRGHDSRLLIASGTGVPVRPDLRMLYPRIFNRCLHSRLHNVTRRLFPPECWIPRKVSVLAQSSFDVIHLHNLAGMITLEKLAELAQRKPLIWTFHAYWNETGSQIVSNSPMERLARGLQTQFDPFLTRSFQSALAEVQTLAKAPLGVVAVSQRSLQALQELQPLTNWTVRLIHNGIAVPENLISRNTLKSQLGFDPLRKLILLVNRDFAIDGKGFGLARAALENTRLDNCEIVLVGRGAETARTSLRLSVPVHASGFLADRPRLLEYYRAADILLFASHHENFPCVTLEAMAMGCAVVTTPTGGVTEQVVDGRTGFVAAEISGRALAAALETALGHPHLQSIGEAARADVNTRFSEERMVEAHLEFYREVSSSGTAS